LIFFAWQDLADRFTLSAFFIVALSRNPKIAGSRQKARIIGVMEIKDSHVEWAVVDRLRIMLERTEKDEYEVTHAFALFSTICGWVRQHVGAFASESNWPQGLAALRKSITEPEWGLLNVTAYGEAEIKLFSDGIKVAIELPKCTAWQFVVWIRNVMAHADHRGVKPVHQGFQSNDGAKLLTGFRFGSDKCYAELSARDMRQFGTSLARIFCGSFSDGPTFECDATQGVFERRLESLHGGGES
jgi:hypothetical protein